MPRDVLAPADPFSADDVLSMTHQPEQPNPAAPYLQAATNFFTSGGDYNPVHQLGTEPKDYLRELHNPEILAKNIEQASHFNFGVVTERFDWPILTLSGKTVDMPITVNPSKSHISRALAESPGGDVRAVRAPNGDVYMWPANEAMHVDIANAFDLPFKTRQELQQSSYLFNKNDVEALGRYSNFDDLVNRLGSGME